MKNGQIKKRPELSLFLLSLLISYPAAGQEEDSRFAVRSKPWEHTLTASNPADGRPPTVEVTFSGPSGKTFTGSAFTDDGLKYTIRAIFPEIGPWRWRAACSDNSDRGLHNVRGRVEVIKYVGDNPLYQHGHIRISEDRRYLIHDDGTPFLWTGDTGWNATYNSTLEEWKTYIDARATQRFNVIQVSPRGVGNRNTASARPDVSFRSDGTNDPEFWKDLEEKIRYANEKGILILLTGVGNAWRDAMALNPGNQQFETYIAGRMASFMVVFSPSFDQLFVNELDKVAAGLRKWTNHLITQHPGTNYSANTTYRNTTSVDFTGLQSGHHGGDISRAYTAAKQWTLDMWQGAPVKPVILLEAMYDGYGHNNAKSWREKDARKPGWIAWMSGARGFTYGAGDVPPKIPAGKGAIWMFNKDSLAYDYWQNALQWESARQITNMRNFLEAMEWWTLLPSPELIRSQPDTDTLRMSISRTADFSTIIAYLPGNERIVIDMTIYLGNFNYTWFDPQTGRYSQSSKIQGGNPNEIFTRPEGWDDAVLKITRL